MINRNHTLNITLLLFVLFIGCDSSVVDQNGTTNQVDRLLPGDQSAMITESTSAIEGEYLLLFKGNKLPEGFSDDVKATGGTVIYQHDSGYAYVSGLSEDAAATFQTRKDLLEFAANTAFSLNLPQAPVVSTDAVVTSTEDPTEAFFYPWQWHHRVIGAEQAWSAGYLGDENVTVAILDGGIDYNHIDLAGLVDLSRSISFIPSDDLLVDDHFPGRNYITDLEFHGTHVAATVASNGIVGAGITSKTTLTGIKVCDLNGDCNFGAIFAGLLYAIETGADIANLSLGGEFIKTGNGRFVGFINSIMNTVRRSGITVVVAAGNDSYNLDRDGVFYDVFCDAPGVICVSATGPIAAGSFSGPYTEIDAPAFYTNFGRSAIDVAAPGGNTGAPVWAACSRTSLLIPDCQTGNFIIGASGTSMAAPHVSGLAALLVSQGITNPARVKAAIVQSADDLGQPGNDPFYGKGRINIANALGL